MTETITTSTEEKWEPWLLTCVERGCKIDARTETFWNRVEGWERKREQGGTNALSLRRPFDEFMCNACMTMRQANLDPGQTNLFG